ncbi:MAG: hypothetical protein ACLTBV_11365 [Enterocloster bolteae]
MTGDDLLKDMITDAADVLAGRFQERGGFIQAWGKMGAEKEYRLIIDSLLNLPFSIRLLKSPGMSATGR